ncbi:MAG TPA: helix-turn-helix transcriptional regulator [Salinarimonas sp.]|nr:helix-turn-helix transcriptional regulator [Salinarimonas sp.]
MADRIPELVPFGITLRQERIRAGYNQEQLAAALGVSQTLVSHAERGGATTTLVAHRWAELCGARLTLASGDDAEETEIRRLYRELGLDDRKRLLEAARHLGAVPPALKDGLLAALVAAALPAGKRS